MGYVVRPVDSTGINPLLYFFCCEMSSLMRRNAMQNTKMMGGAFHMYKDSRDGWSIMFREGKSIFRIHLYSSEDKSLPPLWRGPMKSTCHQVAGWSQRGVVPYEGHSVGLSCQQIKNSSMVLARSALGRESPCCWAHHSLHLCHCGCLVYGSLSERWSKRGKTDLYSLSAPFWPPDYSEY